MVYLGQNYNKWMTPMEKVIFSPLNWVVNRIMNIIDTARHDWRSLSNRLPEMVAGLNTSLDEIREESHGLHLDIITKLETLLRVELQKLQHPEILITNPKTRFFPEYFERKWKYWKIAHARIYWIFAHLDQIMTLFKENPQSLDKDLRILSDPQIGDLDF